MNAPERLPAPPVEALAECGLFAGLAPAQVAAIAVAATTRCLPAGAFVFRAGDVADALYVVVRGAAEIVQEDGDTGERHVLVGLGAGAGFGEGPLAEGAVRPASVRVVQACELLCVPHAALRALMAADADLAVRLQRSLAEQAHRNFRALGTLAVQSLQEKLAIAQAHERSEIFVITMLVVLCAYVFVLQVAGQLLHGRFSTSWLSIPGFIVFFLLFFRAARRSGEPIAAYGVTWRGWRRSLAEGLLASLPLFALCIVAKWLLVQWMPAMRGEPVFALPGNLHTGTAAMAIEAAAYLVFSPFQEFIVRGAMQGSLENFLTGPRRVLKAILVANLMYAMLHLYMSVIFSLMVFIPGLLWGWLYARHRTLVGVTVSHALCGLFCFFVVGFDTLILIYG